LAANWEKQGQIKVGPERKPLMSSADELAELRAEITRLQAREAVLLARAAPQPGPPPRPGWPIRREALH
jgi:hypothetical protein